MELSATVLVMIVWLVGGNSQVQVELFPVDDMLMCQTEGARFMEKALMDPRVKGATFDCGVFSGLSFHQES